MLFAMIFGFGTCQLVWGRRGRGREGGREGERERERERERKSERERERACGEGEGTLNTKP